MNKHTYLDVCTHAEVVDVDTGDSQSPLIITFDNPNMKFCTDVEYSDVQNSTPRTG